MFNSEKTKPRKKLTLISKFNIDDLVFSEPIVGETKLNEKQTIKYRRVRYALKGPNNTYSDLSLLHRNLYSFGVQENRDPLSNQLTGYSIPLCLYGQDGPNEDENEFLNIVDEIVEKTKTFLCENRKLIAKPTLDESDLKKLNPIYYKKDDEGEIIDSISPKLYAKLIFSKKKSEILTKFYDKDKRLIDPSELMEKHVLISPVILFESVFVGSKISIQVKITEAIVQTLDSQARSLLFDNEECEDLTNDNILTNMD